MITLWFIKKVLNLREIYYREQKRKISHTKMMMEMEKVYGEVIICWLSRFRPVLFIRLEIQIQEKNFFRHKVVLGEQVNQQWKFG